MRFKKISKSTHRSILASVIDHPWGIAFVLCTATSAVAYAQATIIPASPISDNAAAIAPAAQQDMPQQTGLINLNFVDVPVVQLITMIAQQGNVGILIGPDVDNKIVIPYINLKDETPQDAIKKAALVAGLTWKKVDEKTYMVGKNLPDVNTTAQSTPAGSNLPILPFSAPTTDANSLIPSAISQAANSGGAVYTPMPNLDPMGSDVAAVDKDKPTYTVIKVRNVPASTLAWWIDPTHQPKPPEYRAAEIGIEQSINPHPMRPAVDPNIMAQLNGNGAVNPYSTYNPLNPNPYANPYQISPVSYGPYNQFNQPYFQGAAQFGGGGGGGFGGGGGSRGGGGSNSSSEGVLEAPKGIGTIISIDAQNALLVYGTADGVAQLRQIIDFLDRPIRQVEIEAQFVDIGTTDANAFGLSFSTNSNLDNNNSTNAVTSNFGTVPSSAGGTSLTATFGHYQATLSALVSNKKARIVNSPRVTTLNNLTAFLFSATATPIVLTSTTSGIGGQVGQQQNAFFLTTSIGLIVTPTINNDDTITVFLTPQVQVQTPVQTTSTGGTSSNNNNSSNSNSSGASSIPAFTSQYMTTVAIVKDGDTIVLGGLRTKNVSYTENSIPILSKLPIIGGLFKSKQLNDDDDELVIFLTARILHRPDDLAPLPGT